MNFSSEELIGGPMLPLEDVYSIWKSLNGKERTEHEQKLYDVVTINLATALLIVKIKVEHANQ